jgi:hypothetical protein
MRAEANRPTAELFSSAAPAPELSSLRTPRRLALNGQRIKCVDIDNDGHPHWVNA